MYPELLKIGSVTIYTYGFMLAVGVIIGYYVSLRASKYRNIPKEYINNLIGPMVISGLAGARLFYVVISIDRYISNPLQILMFWQGGLVFWGGIIGGFLWVLYQSHKFGFSLLSTADVLTPGIAAGHAMGRIGCFFAGCCYGRPAVGFPGVVFRDPGALCPTGIALHPTQLYSAAFLIILSAVLYKILKINTRNGFIFGAYLAFYGVFRILIEFLRGDYRGPLIIGFTPTQWIAAAALFAGLYILYYSDKK